MMPTRAANAPNERLVDGNIAVPARDEVRHDFYRGPSWSSADQQRVALNGLCWRGPCTTFPVNVQNASSLRRPERLDPPSAPPACHGRGYDRGFRQWRAARCDGTGHNRGFCYGCADDTNSSYASSSEGHFSLLRS